MKYKVLWGKGSSQNSPLITPHRIMPHCHLHSTSMSAQVSTRVFPKPAATSTVLISLSAALHSYRDPVPLVSCHSKATDTRFWIFYIIDSIENIVEKSSLTVNTNTQKNFRRVTIENKTHVCMQRGLRAASLSEVNSMGTQGQHSQTPHIPSPQAVALSPKPMHTHACQPQHPFQTKVKEKYNFRTSQRDGK